LAYAATDEFHQSFVEGRHGTPVDWLIDAAGMAVAVLLWRRYSQPRSVA
jgi:VanZ family protein